MGAQINISLVSDKFDKEGLAPFIGRDFVYEIVKGGLWNKRSPFLTLEEAKLLEAPLYNYFDDDSVKPLDPLDLIAVLNKVSRYLKSNEKLLAYEVELDFEKMQSEGLDTDLWVNGVRCWVKGDEVYTPETGVVNIVNLPGNDDVDIWVEVKDAIEVDGKTYYLRTESRYDRYSDLLQRIIDFCNYAISKNEKVYWLYRH